MDMTIAPSVCTTDAERLRQTGRRNAHPVVASVLDAALSIDEGEFRRAQDEMLATINAFGEIGMAVDDETLETVAAVRSRLTGHRHQTCAVRACLDLVEAAQHNPRPYAMGEHIGRLCGSLSEQMAATRLARAA